MKKLTRKLFISVLVAVFAFVALGTSTYAWITLSNTAEVAAFEATVDAGAAGIELSEDYGAKLTEASNVVEEAVKNSTWATVLNLSSATKTELKNKKLNDLTMKYDTNGNMEFYDFGTADYSGSEPGYTAEMKENGKVTDGFITFDIWMKRSSQSEGTTTVKVDGAKVLFETVTGSGAFSYTPADATAISTNNLLASNAARLSITGNTPADTVVYQNAAGVDTDAKNNNTTAYSQDGFAHKYAKAQGIYIAGSGEAYTALESGTDSGAIITLTNQVPQKITVCVWIEGWDNECHAQILNQAFSVEFGFRIVSNN